MLSAPKLTPHSGWESSAGCSDESSAIQTELNDKHGRAVVDREQPYMGPRKGQIGVPELKGR